MVVAALEVVVVAVVAGEECVVRVVVAFLHEFEHECGLAKGFQAS